MPDTEGMRRPHEQPAPDARRTGASWRAVLGLVWRVVAALLVLSLVTIVGFAVLFSLAHRIVPDWAFFASQVGQPMNDPDDLLIASLYIYVHTPAPDPLVPHGPEIGLTWMEFMLSWAWLVVVGSWAIIRWRTILEA